MSQSDPGEQERDEVAVSESVPPPWAAKRAASMLQALTLIMVTSGLAMAITMSERLARLEVKVEMLAQHHGLRVANGPDQKPSGR